jgi:hypothetical protein
LDSRQVGKRQKGDFGCANGLLRSCNAGDAMCLQQSGLLIRPVVHGDVVAISMESFSDGASQYSGSEDGDPHTRSPFPLDA